MNIDELKEKFNLERIRDTINENGVVVGIVCSLLIALVIWQIIPKSHRFPDPNTMKVYYVDDETGVECTQLGKETPPLLNKDGKPNLVRAWFYSYTGCRNRKLAYLEKYTDDAKALKEKFEKAAREPNPTQQDMQEMANMNKIEEGHMVRAPEKGSPWVAIMSPEGNKVTANMGTGDANKFEMCYP